MSRFIVIFCWGLSSQVSATDVEIDCNTVLQGAKKVSKLDLEKEGKKISTSEKVKKLIKSFDVKKTLAALKEFQDDLEDIFLKTLRVSKRPDCNALDKVKALKEKRENYLDKLINAF